MIRVARVTSTLCNGSIDGNACVGDRCDFTDVGEAVNLAARIEKLCRWRDGRRG